MANFLSSKVDTETVKTALEFQKYDKDGNPIVPDGWKQVSAKDLGLSGGSKTFFSSSVYEKAGLEIFRDESNPKNFVLKFSALDFDGVKTVFGHYLGNPPKLTTKYADEFSQIYKAVGKLAKGGDVLATGFSLGGLAVNQLADRANTEFSQSDLSFVALGSEYISKSSADLVNLGAYNDWFFGAYNAYAKLYKLGDPGLKKLKDFAHTVFATEQNLDAISGASFLKKFFSFDRADSTFQNSVKWIFHFNDAKAADFVRENYGAAHNRFYIDAAVSDLGAVPFAKELTTESAIVFDFDYTKNAVLDVTKHLGELPVMPKAIYTIGSNGADDVIKGSKLDDRIAGMSGNDSLTGGVGDDRLYGGAGNDKLNGGAGADDLYGSTGKDVFIFKSLSDSKTSSAVRDTIFDFKSEDTIDLSAIDAVPKTTKNDAFSFIGTKEFTSKAGELRYDKKTSDTYIYADTNGDGKADFAIHLDDAVTMSKGYFLL